MEIVFIVITGIIVTVTTVATQNAPYRIDLTRSPGDQVFKTRADWLARKREG